MKMRTDELIELLTDIAACVRDGDSFEGSITYSATGVAPFGTVEFEVKGAYRIGNRDGQGGMWTIDGGKCDCPSYPCEHNPRGMDLAESRPTGEPVTGGEGDEP